MSLYVASIASGSNGNCYYVGNEQEAVLIDAGISCREIEKRMKRLQLDLKKVKALFISHEHSDHISGVAVLSKKHQLPVYVSSATWRHCRGFSGIDSGIHFDGHETVSVGSLTVRPFRKIHDAADPYSFTISHGGITVGVLTDIGRACVQVKKHLANCHAVFLETNYDEDMLFKGRYPWPLKKRISGGEGHLSNKQALELLQQHASKELSHVFLSHLSKNNNCPQLVQDLFNAHSGGRTIVLAPRDRETDVYAISAEGKTSKPALLARQLTLEW